MSSGAPFATSLNGVGGQSPRTGRAFVAGSGGAPHSDIFASAPPSSPGGRRKFPEGGAAYAPVDPAPSDSPPMRIVNGRVVRADRVAQPTSDVTGLPLLGRGSGAGAEDSAYGGRATGISASSNAYARGAAQNTGNVLTDRPTSRVLAPPGGGSSISLGWPAEAGAHPLTSGGGRARVGDRASAEASSSSAFPRYDSGSGYPAAAPAEQQQQWGSSGGRATGITASSNAYARGASQNTGNVLTDRPTSRVLAAPGGRSTLTLG